jgi:hypothetical protein
MATVRLCKDCDNRISIRKMPHGKWVAFDVATDNPHQCSKKNEPKTKSQKISKQSKKENESINLQDNLDTSINAPEFSEDNFEKELREIDELENTSNTNVTNDREDKKKFSKGLIIFGIIVVILIYLNNN